MRGIVTLPLSGIAYGLAAIGCAVWAICRKTDSIPWSLSGVIFSIAILNAYAEEWVVLKRFRFEYVVPFLMLLFLLPYRSLCLRLIERTGLRAGPLKEMYSFLPLFYAGLAAIAITSPAFAKGENPPFALLIFIVFLCAAHVAMFAAGRSKVTKFVAASKIVTETRSDISWHFLTIAMVVMGIPLVLTLIAEAVLRDDYRLFAVDAVMTAIVFSLLAVSRRAVGQFGESQLSGRPSDFT
jgi:hypothetical protein